MADTFLYLTTTGRTSGLPRSIEIWFVEHAGRYYIVSERREESGWVKNLRKEPSVLCPPPLSTAAPSAGTREPARRARPPPPGGRGGSGATRHAPPPPGARG